MATIDGPGSAPTPVDRTRGLLHDRLWQIATATYVATLLFLAIVRPLPASLVSGAIIATLVIYMGCVGWRSRALGLTAPPDRRTVRLVLVILVILAIISAVIGLTMPTPPSPPPPP